MNKTNKVSDWMKNFNFGNIEKENISFDLSKLLEGYKGEIKILPESPVLRIGKNKWVRYGNLNLSNQVDKVKLTLDIMGKQHERK